VSEISITNAAAVGIKIGDRVRIINAFIPNSMSQPYMNHIGVVHSVRQVTLYNDPPIDMLLYTVFFNGADPGFGFFGSEVELYDTSEEDTIE
jgi:hypothetical protein